MISFREFLVERERTPEEGEKLLKYINHRQRKYARHLSQKPHETQVFIPQHTDYPDHHAAEGQIKRKKAYRNRTAQNVPIDRIQTSQHVVDIAPVVKLMKAYHKKKDVPPAHVVSMSQDFTDRRKHVMVDGHHRMMAQRLLGKKTMAAKVWRLKTD